MKYAEQIGNKKAYFDLIKTLKYWKAEKEVTEGEAMIVYQHAIQWLDEAEAFEGMEQEEDSFKCIIVGVLYFEYHRVYNFLLPVSFSKKPSEFNNLKSWLVYIKEQTGSSGFSYAFLNALNYLYGKIYHGPQHEFYQKMDMIRNILESVTKQDQLAYEFAETPPLTWIENIRDMDIKIIAQTFQTRYV